MIHINGHARTLGLGISKRLVVMITVYFVLLKCEAQSVMIVRIHAGTDYQPGLIQKLFIIIIIIMILLCNPQERVTAN